MCSNYSLSIYPYVSATIHHPAQGGAPQALCSRISSSGTSLGPIVDDFTLMVDAPGPSTLAPHRSQMGTGGDRCRRYPQHPLGGPSSTSSTSVVAAVGPTASTPRGPTIDVSNFGGGRCQTCRQHPQGARHRRLQLRWWPLPALPPAPPRGSSIDVFNFSGGHCWTCRQQPPGGPPSTSPTSMVAATGPVASTPRGPPSTHSTSVVAAAGPAASTPREPAIHVSNFWTSSSDTSRGPTVNAFLSIYGGRSRTLAMAPLGGPSSTAE
jgi:hypothetical protein